MNKIKCCVCTEKDAVWFYMPGGLKDGDFFCDECVPRGCSCNQYHMKEFNDERDYKNVIYWDKDLKTFTKEKTSNSVYFEPVDEKGQRFPCCEYDYSEDGYETDEFLDDIDIFEENGKN